MSSLHRQAKCLSANAFNIRHALYGTFNGVAASSLPGIQVRHVSQRKNVAVSSAHSIANDALVDDAETIPEVTIDHKPRTTSSRLLDALRAIRIRNRNKLIRKIKEKQPETPQIPNDSTPAEATEVQAQNVKIKYLNSIRPNKTIRPVRKGVHGDHTNFLSPIQRFKNGEAVFTELNIEEDANGEVICAKNIVTTTDDVVLDYKGRTVGPWIAREGKAVAVNEPWLTGLAPLQGMPRLTQEIDYFYDYVKPSDAELQARLVVVRQVSAIIQNYSQKHFRGIYNAKVFGSFASGTSLATSDIDIRLIDRRLTDEQWAPTVAYRTRMKRVLAAMRNKFAQSGFEDVQLVHARYPLVSMVHQQSKITVQVVAANSDTGKSQLVRSWATAHPELLPVFATIKASLQIRGLADVFNGGIGSYPLLLMVFASMNLVPGTNAAEHLMNFLRFFADFDTRRKAIGPGPFPRVLDKVLDQNDIPALPYPNSGAERYLHAFYELSAANPTMPFLLCVQDPTDKHNDVGRKSYAWKHIAATFKYLKQDLEDKLAQSSSSASCASLLRTMIGEYHDSFEQLREPIRQYGLSILPPIRSRPTVNFVSGQIQTNSGQSQVETVSNQRDFELSTDWPDSSHTSMADNSTSTIDGTSVRNTPSDDVPISLRQSQQVRSYHASALGRLSIGGHTTHMQQLRKLSFRHSPPSLISQCREYSTNFDFDLPDIPETRKVRKSASNWRSSNDRQRQTESAFSKTTDSSAVDTDIGDSLERLQDIEPVEEETMPAFTNAQTELLNRFAKFGMNGDDADSDEDWSGLFETSEQLEVVGVTPDDATRPESTTKRFTRGLKFSQQDISIEIHDDLFNEAEDHAETAAQDMTPSRHRSSTET